MGQVTRWYHWLISVIVCICGILSVSVDVDPDLRTFLVALSAFVLGIMKTKLPTLPPLLVDILGFGIPKILKHFKKKKTDTYYLLLLLLIPLLFISGCSNNPYAEKMSKIAVQDCQALFISRLPGVVPKSFTQSEVELYLTGFMRANKISSNDTLEIIKKLRENGYKVTKEIENILLKYNINLLPE